MIRSIGGVSGTVRSGSFSRFLHSQTHRMDRVSYRPVDQKKLVQNCLGAVGNSGGSRVNLLEELKPLPKTTMKLGLRDAPLIADATLWNIHAYTKAAQEINVNHNLEIGVSPAGTRPISLFFAIKTDFYPRNSETTSRYAGRPLNALIQVSFESENGPPVFRELFAPGRPNIPGAFPRSTRTPMKIVDISDGAVFCEALLGVISLVDSGQRWKLYDVNLPLITSALYWHLLPKKALADPKTLTPEKCLRFNNKILSIFKWPV